VTSGLSRQIRVAAAQCAIGSNMDENLTTCLRVLDKAAAHKPELVVLPEFCNHLSWYDNADHCYEVSLSLDSSFLAAIAEKAQAISAYVSIGATLRRASGKVSGSVLLYSPQGKLLGIADKQVLIGHENDFLQPALEAAPIIATDIGRLAMYMCMDGVINETPHCLALRGAQVLCNSLNSFAPDEGNLHIPVRAAENKVFVVAANKIGPLVPEAMMANISATTNIPDIFLCGAGESQIVAPDGTVLAMAKTCEEEVISALINPAEADDKTRPDGSDIITSRRPELYASLSQNPATQTLDSFAGQVDLLAAMIRWQDETIDEVCKIVIDAQASGAQLIVLSPRMGFSSLQESDLAKWQQRGAELVRALAPILKDNIVVVSGQVGVHGDGYQHQVVAIGEQGIIAVQGQVHFSQRFAWSELDDGFHTFDLPFGRLCMLTSDDSIYPESFRLCAMAAAEIAVVPMMPLEHWELHTGLVERAAENRLNLLAATSSFEFGHGFAAGLHADFTIFSEWKTRKFDGVLTRPPLLKMRDDSAITLVMLHPANAGNKVVSRNTHLIDNRPWHLLQPMTAAE
jgi:predicted amidohydrolase